MAPCKPKLGGRRGRNRKSAFGEPHFPGRSSLSTSPSTPAPLDHSPNQSEDDFPVRWSSSHGSKRISDYRGQAKTLGGTINGVRCGDYSCVTVLFATWQDDDMNCIQELQPLRQVFEDEFHYRTQFYQFPSDQPMRAFNKELSKMDNPPGGLIIFYYGGHGYIGTDTKKLKLAAEGQPYTKGNLFYQDIIDALKHFDGDLLLILDACFAGGGIYHHKLPRAVELLASSAHDRMTPGPDRPGSFTPILADKLRLLLKENPQGFLVSDLFYALDIDDRLKSKPRWYPQSEMDCRRISLRPQIERPAPQTEAMLHLCLSIAEPPDTRVLLDIANFLRFTPHVKKITVGELNAPNEMIQELKKMIAVADMFRWWARRARAKLEAYSPSQKARRVVDNMFQATSFGGNSAGEMTPVRISELCPSTKPHGLGVNLARPRDKPPPKILPDGRDPPTCSNPYSLLADDSSPTPNTPNGCHNANPHLTRTGEKVSATATESNTSSLDNEPSQLALGPKKRGRRRNCRKRKVAQQSAEPLVARTPSYKSTTSITAAALLVLFLFIALT